MAQPTRLRWLPTSVLVAALASSAQVRAGTVALVPVEGEHEDSPSTAKDGPCPGSRCLREQRMWLHALGLRYDVGSASAYGAGYVFGRAKFGEGYTDAAFLGVLALGLDARAITRDHSRVDATACSLAARASANAAFGGLGLELLGGIANPRRGPAQGMMSVGLYWSLWFLELGYSYQFPLTGDRKEWMSSHQFSLRIDLPIYRQGIVITDYPAP